ncbi:MAG: 3,4-dihydroxy-2-butanone-4-phosphate synthase [Saprospiraceae bacterium]|nr:3,4-dihydroxy-2-butanone-4-phosphate synthase [Saprospiraceae bacterium]
MSMFNTIEEAIADFKEGKLLIVVDNEDRENEGDFICAAETITPELVNFMALQGRGLLCAPLEETRADLLNLPLMVRNNTSLHETAFTVSVDLIGKGCTTGISTHDRCLTIQALANDAFSKEDFARPGHIFPLRAKPGGVLQRAGHTEAVVDLAKLSGMAPAGALIEILNDDGSMARLPQLFEKSKQFGLKIISIHDLIEYRLRSERLIKAEKSINCKVDGETYRLIQYRQINTNDLHFAFVKGNIQSENTCYVRVQHSDALVEWFDLFVQGDQSLIKRAFTALNAFPEAILLMITNQNRSDDPLKRLTGESEVPYGALVEQHQREIGIGAQILKDLNVGKMIVLSNHPRKTISLEAFGLEILSYLNY